MASMAAMVSSEVFTRFRVPRRIRPTSVGRRRRYSAAAIAVSSRAVPVAESGVQANTAAVGEGLATTGGTLTTSMSRKGTLMLAL
jgi:hypothetical protein